MTCSARRVSSSGYPSQLRTIAHGLGVLGALALLAASGCDAGSDEGATEGSTATDGESDGTGGPSTDGETGSGETGSGETDPSGSSGDPSTGDPVDLDVNPPCVEVGLGVVLPEAVLTKASENEFASTAVEARDDIAVAVEEVLALPFPDASAVPAEVDDLTVFEGDVAYVWDEYLYVENGDGYSIYQDDGGLLPDEIVYVDQNADCSSVSVSHYGREGDGTGVPDGQAILFFSFDQAGTAKSFQWSRWEEPRPEFSMREFEDGSGDFQRNLDGQADLNLQWNADGEGTYTRYEDGAEVDGGLW
ncbi:MAG: hypothetical protein ACE37F_27310 [Nannocystaceae bacterium]|nr:hypothetical protein [bacterium]